MAPPSCLSPFSVRHSGAAMALCEPITVVPGPLDHAPQNAHVLGCKVIHRGSLWREPFQLL